jgi:serine/threonine protein kinase
MTIAALAPLGTGAACLVEAVQKLSLARDVATIQEIVRRAARRLTGADGATFVLRDGDRCHYADEDAIAPLWKGQRFPMSACISGWAMLNRHSAVIPDIYADDRIPHDAYRRTFVKSLVMVPIRTLDPVGAIGNYWAEYHQPTDEEVALLQALADSTAVAMENVRLFAELEERVRLRTAELEEVNRQLVETNRELVAAHDQADRVFAAYAKALPGTVLENKYRLDEELGSGGFGVVYRGRHLILEQPVAIKVFRPMEGNDSASGLQRFLREGAAASRIRHPNAVRVLDTGVCDGIAFLVMELLEGRSLADELAEVGTLPLGRCVRIAAAVAQVLAVAHREGILHRDVKPENVFLHRADGEEVVKVLDFGIAKFVDDKADTAKACRTRTGEFMGTPSFIAPERICGGSDDGRSDVYSLGAMLYQMVSGVLPFGEQRVMAVMLGVTDGGPPAPPSRHRPGVPAELDALIQRALAWSPADRPTAQELAEMLEVVAENVGEATAPVAVQASPRDLAPTMVGVPGPNTERQ